MEDIAGLLFPRAGELIKGWWVLGILTHIAGPPVLTEFSIAMTNGGMTILSPPVYSSFKR